MNKVQKRLKAARELVEKGWVQGSYRARPYDYRVSSVLEGAKVCYCATGAIAAVGLEDPGDLGVALVGDTLGEEAVAVFARSLGLAYEGPGAVANWNDAPDRTHAQVLKAFNDAIALAEKGVEA